MVPGNESITVLPAEHVGCKIPRDWDVEEIVGKKKVGSVELYEVRWAKSWVTKEDLSDAPELLQEFEAKSNAQIAI